MEVFKEYRFEAAHHLPQVGSDHPCARLHGHSYRIVIHVAGDLRPQEGWVVDFAVIDGAVRPLLDQLDHSLLNELEGLPNPTCEHLARWIGERLAPRLRGLARVEVWETVDAGCVLPVREL